MGLHDLLGRLEQEEEEDLTQVYIEGRHMTAFRRMQKLYGERMSAVRAEYGSVQMLDYGTGRNGVSRTVAEPHLKERDRLALYDPKAAVSPAFGRSRIVTRHEADKPGVVPYNLLSLAYVLSWMERDDAVETLVELRAAHPEAEFIVVDYLLKGRANMVGLLRAKEETAWKQKVGPEEFTRTHTRFDPAALSNLLNDADMPCNPGDVKPLDDLSIRGAVVIPPAAGFFPAW